MPLVVPMRPGPVTAQSPTPSPDPTFVLMAAAQMHSEGRLVKPDPTPPSTPTNPSQR